MYERLASHLDARRGCVFGVIIQLDNNTGWITQIVVYGLCPLRSANMEASVNDRVCQTVLLNSRDESTWQDVLARVFELFRASAVNCGWPCERTRDENRVTRRVHMFHTPDGPRVFKLYRSPDTLLLAGTQTRRLGDMTVRFLGGQWELRSPQWYIVSYPWLEGGHTPALVADWTPIFRTLNEIHEEGLCHADIHIYNLVFHGANSRIIDFDYCGLEDRLYPPGWCADLQRYGRRHDGARAGRPMRQIHDLYSLGAAMEIFSINDPAPNAIWRQISQRLVAASEDNCIGLLTECLAQLEEIAESALNAAATFCDASGGGTGSPEQRPDEPVPDQQPLQEDEDV
jgi:hypothetical protein